MAADKKTICDAWNPGITSTIPPHLAPSVTLYRPENGLISYAEAVEAARLCGLSPQNMAVLRVERLIIHELLLRVTSDLSVPDGPNYADLGISLRAMVDRIFRHHMMPEMERYSAAFDQIKAKIRTQLDNILAASTAKPSDKSSKAKNGHWLRFLGFSQRPPSQSGLSDEERLALW